MKQITISSPKFHTAGVLKEHKVSSKSKNEFYMLRQKLAWW